MLFYIFAGGTGHYIRFVDFALMQNM